MREVLGPPRWWQWVRPRRAYRQWEQSLHDRGVYQEHVGWGPFPLPGEWKRTMRAHEEAKRMMDIAHHVDGVGKLKKLDDVGAPWPGEDWVLVDFRLWCPLLGCPYMEHGKCTAWHRHWFHKNSDVVKRRRGDA